MVLDKRKQNEKNFVPIKEKQNGKEKLRMGKILVTGATGYLGREVLKFLDKGRVRCLVRKGKIADVENVPGDVTDAASLQEAVQDVECVVHLAAVTHARDDHLFQLVNVNGTKNLLEASKKAGVKHFILVSSMAATRKYLDTYGISKKKGEELIQDSGVPYTILRPTMMYGGESKAMRDFLAYVRKFPLIVPVLGSGKGRIQPVHVDDVARIIARCVEQGSKNKVYALVGGTTISMNYFIDFVLSRLRLRKLKVHIPLALAGIFGGFFGLKKEFIKSLAFENLGDAGVLEADFRVKPRRLSQAFRI